MAHPLRLRILRMCGMQELTNKQLADRLDRDPGTVLYHLRQLTAVGLLEVGPGAHRGERGVGEALPGNRSAPAAGVDAGAVAARRCARPHPGLPGRVAGGWSRVGGEDLAPGAAPVAGRSRGAGAPGWWRSSTSTPGPTTNDSIGRPTVASSFSIGWPSDLRFDRERTGRAAAGFRRRARDGGRPAQRRGRRGPAQPRRVQPADLVGLRRTHAGRTRGAGPGSAGGAG